jgi:hypothetical protein
LFITPKAKNFIWRLEQNQVCEGGFALITGDPGTGKSVVLRLLAERLEPLRDVTVGVLTHRETHLADFYREMGDVAGCGLKPNNRWGASRHCANAGRLISRIRSYGRYS